MRPAFMKAGRIPELEIVPPGIGSVNIIHLIIFSQLFGHNVICRLQAAVKLHLRKNDDVLVSEAHVKKTRGRLFSLNVYGNCLALGSALLCLNLIARLAIIPFISTIPD